MILAADAFRLVQAHVWSDSSSGSILSREPVLIHVLDARQCKFDLHAVYAYASAMVVYRDYHWRLIEDHINFNAGQGFGSVWRWVRLALVDGYNRNST